MQYDREKVEEVVMALLTLTMFREHGVARAWKGQDWDVMEALFERGWIDDPKSKARSVIVTPEGEAKARELFERHFGSSGGQASAGSDPPS